MQAPPLPVMSLPHRVESDFRDGFLDMVEAREGGIELLAGSDARASAALPSPDGICKDIPILGSADNGSGARRQVG